MTIDKITDYQTRPFVKSTFNHMKTTTKSQLETILSWEHKYVNIKYENNSVITVIAIALVNKSYLEKALKNKLNN